MKISGPRCTIRIFPFGMKVVAVFFVGAGLTFAAQAGSTMTQSISLNTGWNAVYLEVDPDTPAPEQVFAGLPVDTVATHDVSHHGAQFVKNPAADLSLAQGWAVWYAQSRPDAFLSNLYEVQGAKAYLIHATTNATLTLTGEVPPVLTTWKPDAFNFVGFSLQDPGAPTFAQFFAGSSAHTPGRIYRLSEGIWRQVLDPGAETMRGRAKRSGFTARAHRIIQVRCKSLSPHPSESSSLNAAATK